MIRNWENIRKLLVNADVANTLIAVNLLKGATLEECITNLKLVDFNVGKDSRWKTGPRWVLHFNKPYPGLYFPGELAGHFRLSENLYVQSGRSRMYFRDLDMQHKLMNVKDLVNL